MKQPGNAEYILDLVLSLSTDNQNLPAKVLLPFGFFIIHGQYGPRWIVPDRPIYGKSVLAGWHPYNFGSRIKWKGLKLSYVMKLMGKIPGIHFLPTQNRSLLQIPGIDSFFVPVMYIGTPGPHQKVVVTLVSPESGEPRAIMKVALSEEARISLLQESVNLEKLSSAGILGVPISLGAEKDGNRTWQTVVRGQLTSRELTRAHIDWLLSLPRSDRSTTLTEQQKLLRRKFELNPGLFGTHKQAISDAIDSIHGGQVPLLLVHGDFAPWNLKKQCDGTISAIDWEAADWSGFPLWDLCHFF